MTAQIKIKGTPPRPVGYCKECGHPFYPKREDQDFCATGCRNQHHKRRYERGAKLYDFAIHWRSKRPKGAFTEFCQIVDEYIRDNKARAKVRKETIKQHKEALKNGIA